MKDLDSMEKTVSSQDAPGRFGDLLQGVSDKGDRYVVEQDGVPLTAVVPCGNAAARVSSDKCARRPIVPT